MSNLLTLTQALEKKRAELEKLQQEVEQAREQELTALPRQVGFETMDDLIRALAAYASPRIKSLLSGDASARIARAPRNSPAAGESEAAGKRTRMTITDEMRQRVIALANEGKTGAEIATAVGISLPSVANIKKAAGLTKTRGKS